MSRTGRPGRRPAWYKGRKVLEHYSGAEYYENDGKLMTQEGKLVDKQNFDSVTDKERAEQVQRRIR
jgi:hypothetical protein